MKITNEQAEYFLSLPKKVVQNDIVMDKLNIEQKFPVKVRYELVSEEDDEFTFLWEINHVEGYKSLAWAVPLSVDKFEIKELNNDANFNTTFVKIIKQFAKTVNIETVISVNELLL